VPRYAAECRRVRGNSWGPPQTRTCGISVRLSAPLQPC
jgi:hypothetical protein